MNQPDACLHCGAKLVPGSKFCEACGKPVTNVTAASLAAPPASTPGSKTGLYVALAIVGAIVVVGCMALAVFGFLYLRNQTAPLAQLPISTPPVAAVPTFSVPTSVLPSAAPTVQPPTSVPPSIAPTTQPPTSAPIASDVPTAAPPPTPVVAPGLYVTSLRLEPSPPKRGQGIGFYATFLNTAADDQNTRWVVYIYRPDNFKNSFGETSTAPMTMPVGQKELQSLGSWKLGGGGGCEDFVARVAWKDEGNRVTFFNKPDGTLFELPFQVCP